MVPGSSLKVIIIVVSWRLVALEILLRLLHPVIEDLDEVLNIFQLRGLELVELNEVLVTIQLHLQVLLPLLAKGL